MAQTRFSGPVVSDNGFIGATTGMAVLPAYTTTTLPTVVVGGLIYVSDANSNAGTVCFGKGSSWVDIKTGLAVVA